MGRTNGPIRSRVSSAATTGRTSVADTPSSLRPILLNCGELGQASALQSVSTLLRTMTPANAKRVGARKTHSLAYLQRNPVEGVLYERMGSRYVTRTPSPSARV